MYREAILATGLFIAGAIVQGPVKDSPLLLRACKDVGPASGTAPFEQQPGRFTLAVIPDTQQYCQDWSAMPFTWPRIRNPYLEQAVAWIIRHREDTNTVFVSHLGDMVDRNAPSRWTVVRSSFDAILNAGIPLGIDAGNHDMEASRGTAELFQEYFPESKFKDYTWYGGSFPQEGAKPNTSGNNVNSYQLITAGQHDILLLHLECNAPDNVVAWADDVLKQHAGRMAVVITHMWLGPVERPVGDQDFTDAPKGRMGWVKCHGAEGNTSEALWQKLVRKHGNIALVLSGDQSQTETMALSSRGDAGNTVHQLMIDHGSGRYLQLLNFDLDQGKVDVVTWDVLKGERLMGTPRVPDPAQWQFSLPIDIRLPSS
ncbi:metallophosphoesterase [Aestuariivirga sp.]|uniref:metallophosphoesterase n=1 Tax=Aestuariivirga sp. TaxID=2650926 RepID=UPI003BA9E155